MEALSEACLLITGIMASGKSSVAQAVAERLPKSVHLRGDVFRRMIINGRAEMESPLPDAAMMQLRLRYQLAAQAADGYCGAGFTVVCQDVIIGEILNEVVEMHRNHPLYLVVLCPSPDVALQRDKNRHKHTYSSWTPEGLDRALREETPRLGLWLDSSNLTIAETVDAILGRIHEARIGGKAIMSTQQLNELKELLQKDVVEERLKALKILSTYDHESKSAGIIEALIHTVELDTDTAVRRQAAAALETLKATEAQEVLLRVMKTDESVRGWAALALGRIGGDGVYEELLSSYRQEPYHITQWMLLQAISTLKDPRSLTLFQEILGNWKLVDQKITALWGVYELLGEEALPIVAPRIYDFHGTVAQSHVANVAIAVLEKINTEEAKTIVSNWKALYKPSN